MTTDRTAADSPLPRRLQASGLVAVAVATGAYVMRVVAHHTIAIVEAKRLLPRWDLATHLGHGWLDYHFLATGRIHRLVWDLWMQGYWPPGLSIYQVPFYLVLGPAMTSGLWSTPVAFVLLCATGSALMWRQWGQGALLPASLFLALLFSSPFLLAYSTVTMTEMLGALVQVVVLLCYVRDRQQPTARSARLFAISLTALFFVKFNYFVLLAVPLLIHEWLERTARSSAARRLASLQSCARALVTSPTAVLVCAYVAAVLIVVGTGGFEFRLFGARVSVRTIGNSGHVVLYALLARLWYLHGRGRIDWARLESFDRRVRALLVWFVLPVTIWLASPYPNHIRDFANLVINRPLGDPTLGAGASTYLDALATDYFYRTWVLAAAIAAFAVAAVRYERQPPLMRCLILAVPLQFGAIAVHQTRFPRFLLLTVVLLCVAAASEVGGWFAGSRRGRMAAGLVAPLVLAAGVVAARHMVTEERFRLIAFEHYVASDSLRLALDAIRGDLGAGDRLAVVGQSNDVSPGLLRWELGPPSGVACFPFQIAGAGRIDPGLATRVLLVETPGAGFAPMNVGTYDPETLRRIRDAIDRGELVLRREFAVTDLQVVLRLYGRALSSDRAPSCQ